MSDQSRMAALAAMVAISLIFFTASVVAADPEPKIYVNLSDTTVQAGSDEAWVSVFLANYQDTLAAFSIYIQADRPDIIAFQTNSTDPLTPGGVDTAGTALTGWEFVHAESYTGNRSDIKVIALSDTPAPPFHPGLPPQAEPILLMRLKITAASELPFASDSLVNLLITTDLSLTGFSDPSGNLIGTEAHYNICDTTYWRCLEWVGDTCLAWEPTDPGTADSIRIDTFFTYWCCDQWDGENCLSWSVCLPPGDSVEIDSVRWTSWDTTAVTFENGSVRLIPPLSCCVLPGDVNDDGTMNIGDPVMLINYIFSGGSKPPCPQAADVDGDCQINAADVINMIRPIFQIAPWKDLQCGPDSCVYEGY